MGIFQFMAPAAGNTESAFAGSHTGFTVHLTAVVNGKDVASAGVIRQGSFSVGVSEKDYRPASGGLYADMFLPKASPTEKTSLHPAVLAFGGSEGGLNSSSSVAAQLAAHGYPTLSLAYFAEPGLPAHLANIPLEYFVRALTLLRREPGVDPKHVLVMGVSRGGEAALLLGATYPSLIDGVIAGVPSSVVNAGYPDSAEPAWTVAGHDLQELTIPVQRIRGPVLVTCGGQDRVWNSCGYTSAITDTLKTDKFAYPVTSLRYPNAGHFGGEFNGYLPITRRDLSSAAEGFTGGTVNATEYAWADNTRHLLALLAAQH
jgi:dienelactone hydrolase